MIGGQQRRFVSNSLSYFAPPLQAVLVKLAEAHDYARDVECDPWQYAVEIDRLKALGATTSDLLWLIRNGCVEHRKEITRPSDAEQVPPGGNAAFRQAELFRGDGRRTSVHDARIPPTDDAVRGVGSVDACN